MTEIVTDVSDAAMAAAIENNLEACFRILANQLLGDVRDHGAFTTVLTGLPGPGFNPVFSRLTPDAPSDTLDEPIAAVIEYVSQRQVPISWFLLPSSLPPALPRRLEAYGFLHTHDSPGMAADLHALNETVSGPARLSIEAVADPEALREWTRTGLRGFGMLDAPEEVFYHVFAHLPYGPGAPSALSLARLDGEPVAISVVVFGAGVAGVYNVATVPEHRGKGIGALVTLAALQEARARGYRVGILESSHMGFPIYQRLGFRQYITIAHYAWPPEQSTSASNIEN